MRNVRFEELLFVERAHNRHSLLYRIRPYQYMYSG